MSLTSRQTRIGLNGDEAVAYAVMHADVDVVAAYPITPQTIIVEKLSEFIFNGELDAEMIHVESEHSALSAVIASALAGARSYTATASQGLALMYELLYVASGLRAPVVMTLGNRAFSAPINIHCSHDDAYAVRDSGWIQFFAESVQEAYDLTLVSFKVAEDERILLPVLVNLDGFILTHSVEPLNIFNGIDDVKEFLPPRKMVNVIDPSSPRTYGALALPDYYMEIKMQQADAMKRVKPYIVEILDSYGEFSGRTYSLIKPFYTDDAEIIIIVLGSTAGTLRYMVRKWREGGEKVGLLSLTLYRPFPVEEVINIVKDTGTLIVMDRSYSFGSPGGQLYMDVAAALSKYRLSPRLVNVIYGLGGRDFTPDMANRMLRDVKTKDIDEMWIGVRGE
jgi:pyruvate ferredoxin oxidoreductase alpha subunit